jgi:antirestriction protein ArdC
MSDYQTTPTKQDVYRRVTDAIIDAIEQGAGTYRMTHETTHWTSHVSRCDRQLGKRFGDAAYAMEELIAELGSAYTMAGLELELTPRKDHAAYIDSWLKVLKSDKRAIFTAASQAQKAADWLMQRSGRTAQVAEVAA